ncbi:MAG: class III signal peptide-containing protein [Methanobrevibacter sp.]|nr:class III signal peptide-containing protein [Methanobrevibacter sp.]
MQSNIKKEFTDLNKEIHGQGAAEYILLFGGVIVIAIAALLIYRQYFENTNTELNASQDINDVRNAMNSTL